MKFSVIRRWWSYLISLFVSRPPRKKMSVKSLLEALNRQKIDDSQQYYAVIYIAGQGPAVVCVDTGEQVEDTLGFDVIGPLDIDPSLEINNFLDHHGGNHRVVHRLAGRVRGVAINPTVKDWKDSVLGLSDGNLYMIE